MLIIEGCDLVGKTTLANKLVAVLRERSEMDVLYHHLSFRPAKFDFLWGYVAHMKRWAVYDRFHLGEIAYSQAQGEKPRISQDDMRLIYSYLFRHGSFIVVIRAEPDQLELAYNNCGGNKEPFALDVLQRVNFVYSQLESSEHLFDVMLDYKHGQPIAERDDLVNYIANAYISRQHHLNRAIIRRQSCNTMSLEAGF